MHITQNKLDGEYEARIGNVTCRAKDYCDLEAHACEVAEARAIKARTEDSFDCLEKQPRPVWGGAENAVAALGAAVVLGVLAAGYQIAWWLLTE